MSAFQTICHNDSDTLNWTQISDFRSQGRLVGGLSLNVVAADTAGDGHGGQSNEVSGIGYDVFGH